MQPPSDNFDPITIHNSSCVRCLPAQCKAYTYHQRYGMWGFRLPHVVRPAFESQWTEQHPDCREIPKEIPSIKTITHQEVPVRTNPERPGDLPLAHVSTCPYRQLTDNSQSHSQPALNSAASILAKLKEDATSSNPQFSTCNQAKSPNQSTRNCLS